jgi:hypothetical protein
MLFRMKKLGLRAKGFENTLLQIDFTVQSLKSLKQLL